MSVVERSTKLDIVNSTLSKIAISGITAPAMGEDYRRVLNRLEGMMYEFSETLNICTDYNFTPAPCGSDKHGMRFGLVEPISNILALRVLQDYGLEPGSALIASANAGVSALSAETAIPRETQYPRRQPRGAGNTLRYNRWQRFYRKPDRVPVICSTFAITTNEINDYTESFNDYLRSGEDIESYRLRLTGGIELISVSESDGVINYRIRGLNPSIDSGVEQIQIRIVTTDGRLEERLINAEVLPLITDNVRFIQDVD